MKNADTFLVIVCLFAFSEGWSQKTPKDYKLVYEQSFDQHDALKGFTFTQNDRWILSAGKKGKALEFTGISEYQPPFRSPHTLGFINDLVVGSFVLEADLLQTGKEYGHRDMCIAFGFTDPANFYYSHIATKMDDNAHQIMLVNNAPRRKISTFTTQGVDWGDAAWQKIRIERNAETGMIKVFFNQTLIQEASDKTFTKGHIGFGSFDDSGKIDNIKIWAKESERKELGYFKVN
jgi:hypothetical protein